MAANTEPPGNQSLKQVAVVMPSNTDQTASHTNLQYTDEKYFTVTSVKLFQSIDCHIVIDYIKRAFYH